MSLPVALQLYTVRDEMEKDFIGTLGKVADIGYKSVEFAGFGGIPAARLKDVLDGFGLTAVGSHTSIGLLTDKLDEVIEYNLVIGNKYVVCPFNKYESKEDLIKASRFYNETGEKLKSSGLQLLYHNHDFEFKRYDGQYGIDILFEGVKLENMMAEIDTGWAFYAGVDVPALVRRYKGRCPLAHLKDFSSTEREDFTELGNGLVDIKAIAAAAVEAGTKCLIVEQDECVGSTLENARINLGNLRKMGLA